MMPKDLQKMCPHCEGRIPIEASECLYCAMDQSQPGKGEASPTQAPLFKSQSLQDSLASLYTPPYGGKQSPVEEKKEVFKKMAEVSRMEMREPSSSFGTPSLPEGMGEEEETDAKESFWPLLILMMGGTLLTVGLLQFFFSDNGVLRLEWESRYWFFYCLISVPFFFFGFKKANLLK